MHFRSFSAAKRATLKNACLPEQIKEDTMVHWHDEHAQISGVATGAEQQPRRWINCTEQENDDPADREQRDPGVDHTSGT